MRGRASWNVDCRLRGEMVMMTMMTMVVVVVVNFQSISSEHGGGTHCSLIPCLSQ